MLGLQGSVFTCMSPPNTSLFNIFHSYELRSTFCFLFFVFYYTIIRVVWTCQCFAGSFLFRVFYYSIIRVVWTCVPVAFTATSPTYLLTLTWAWLLRSIIVEYIAILFSKFCRGHHHLYSFIHLSSFIHILIPLWFIRKTRWGPRRFVTIVQRMTWLRLGCLTLHCRRVLRLVSIPPYCLRSIHQLFFVYIWLFDWLMISHECWHEWFALCFFLVTAWRQHPKPSRCCKRSSCQSPVWSTSCGERLKSSRTYGTATSYECESPAVRYWLLHV